MSRSSSGKLGFLEHIRTLLADDSLYDGRPPEPKNPGLGRKRKNPYWVWMLYNQLVAEHRNIAAVARNLADPDVWKLIADEGQRRFPTKTHLHASKTPMTRAEYLYLLDLAAATDENLEGVRDAAEIPAALFAHEMGLLSGQSSSLTNPAKADLLCGDGVAVRSLYNPIGSSKRAKPSPGGHQRTGDNEAHVHKTGDGRDIYGHKFTQTFARQTDPGTRLILTTDYVPGEDEGSAAINAVRRIQGAGLNPALLIWDGALRGKHINQLLTERGVPAMAPMHAKKAATDASPREEKELDLGEVDVHGGRVSKVRVAAVGGRLHIRRRASDGTMIDQPLDLIKVSKRVRKDGTSRWFGEWSLPPQIGGTLSVRFDQTSEDERLGRNRPENLRMFPKGTRQWDKLYGRRSDAESSNKVLKDSLYGDRARCLGARRLLVMMYGFQRAQNALTIARWRADQETAAAA